MNISFNNVKKHFIKVPYRLFYMVAVISGFYTAFLYLNNIGEVLFKDFATMLSLIVCMGVFLCIIVQLFLQDWNQAAFCSSVFMILFTNYNMAEAVFIKIFNPLRYWHVISILLSCWIILVVFVKGRKTNILTEINKLICIVFTGLLLLNLVTNTGNIIEKIVNSTHTNKEDYSTQSKDNSSELPNASKNQYETY